MSLLDELDALLGPTRTHQVLSILDAYTYVEIQEAIDEADE